MTFRAQVVFPMFTNLPKDVLTNTFSFIALTPIGVETVATVATPWLADFYEVAYGSGGNMAAYMLPGGAHVNWYDLDDPQPRQPHTVPLGATISLGSSEIPTEVAAVVSFQGDPVSGINQASRRGRIYLGALTNAHLEPGSGLAFPTLTIAAVTSFRNAAEGLMDASGSSADVRWTVHSPTLGTDAEVTNGWVDQSPDTQRRRSVDATSRVVFPV